MHILLITPNYYPEVNAPATRQHEHCRRWAQLGHQVTVIAPAPHWPVGKVFPGYKNRWASREAHDGVQVLRVWTLLSANRGFLLRTLAFVTFMLRAVLASLGIRSVDVIVATSPQFFAGLAGTIASRIKRRPFVLEIRDIWPESIVDVGAMRRSPLIRLLEWLERRMYQSANHIVTVGGGYREKLLQRGVPADKISVVTNGVDLDAWRPAPPDDAMLDLHNSRGKFVCAYVGTIGMAHGLDVVLDAAEELQQREDDSIVFWLVGDGARREELERDAKRRRLTNVRFLGQVSKPQVQQVLASSDACLVHLRGTELFGTVIPSKIFETMAMEAPIIMGVRGEAQDVVLAAQAGVPMEPDSWPSLLAALEQLQSGLPGNNGRSFVAQFYNRDKLAARMLTILQNHAEQPPNTPAHRSTPNISKKAA